jgi:hypothetical protein
MKISLNQTYCKFFFQQISTIKALQEYIHLNASSFQYPVSFDLTQFYVVDQKFNTSNTQVTVQLTFQRMFLFHLTNTYMPTLTLLIIAEVTLFCKDSQLELAIGLSLTVMLVMYTMYQGVSNTLPQTAYLKFIDVWLIVCLLVQINSNISTYSQTCIEQPPLRPKRVSVAQRFFIKICS